MSVEEARASKPNREIVYTYTTLDAFNVPRAGLDLTPLARRCRKESEVLR